MSNRTDKDFLLDIQEAIRRIKSYTHEMRYEEFLTKISVNSSATNAKS